MSLLLWQAGKTRDDFPASETRVTLVVVLFWRQGLVSQYRSLREDEARPLLGMCRQGWSFAQLCERLAAQGELAPVKAAGWLKQWISAGWLLNAADHAGG